MKEVFLVKPEDKLKAEDALKKDDVVSRGSIMLRAAASLDIKEEGYFIIVDCSAEGIAKARELLKTMAIKHGKKEIVLQKIEDQENAALQGFGSFMG
ncbi:MAG TPA: hypothetical protein VI979_01540 [archaeon]|nr:hypothetical protein [Candidatus Aenigmarchaeota archaeon]HLD83519.1 hypothetical protein [archaeon]